MKICIIGAGFTGLSAAYYLQKKGHKVTVFEKDLFPGGLAVGFQEKKWKWSLEKHYHHFFTNDHSILCLASEIGFPIITKRPKTSVLIDNKIYQLDSPIKLLSFNKLSIISRLRMAFILAFLRYNPFWKLFEPFYATRSLRKLMGENAYKAIWEPQMAGKFGEYKDTISLAWFWARIKKRTSSLSYPKGGFLAFAKTLEEKIVKSGGIFYYNTEVVKIKSGGKTRIFFKKNNNQSITSDEFDKIIVTLPSFLFQKITPELPDNYKEELNKLSGIGAINILLRLKKPFLQDGTYWLSICEKNWPITAIVEHTNYMDKKNYNGEHLVYIGKYLSREHKYFGLTDEKLLKEYHPFLEKINKDYKKNLISYNVFRAPFAQPIIPINYSKIIPQTKTPLKNVYLANIQQVYPWDRGTNYAVELGEKIANSILQ